MGDERTLKNYLKYLEDGKAVTCLLRQQKSIRGLEKPEKIYLNNPNQAVAICDHENVNEGTLREMFFICMLQEGHTMVLDHIENGIDAKIPLWLFGFLY